MRSNEYLERSVTCQVPLRWGDMDPYGHVNNVEVIRVLEEARIATFGVPVGTGEQVAPAKIPPLLGAPGGHPGTHCRAPGQVPAPAGLPQRPHGGARLGGLGQGGNARAWIRNCRRRRRRSLRSRADPTRAVRPGNTNSSAAQQGTAGTVGAVHGAVTVLSAESGYAATPCGTAVRCNCARVRTIQPDSGRVRHVHHMRVFSTGSM